MVILAKLPPVWFTEQSDASPSIGPVVWIVEKSASKRYLMNFHFINRLPSVWSDEREKAILRTVDRLPPEQKEVLTLKIWGELTFDEIGRTLDLSLNTVASRYRYALQKLKEWLPAELEDNPKSKDEIAG